MKALILAAGRGERLRPLTLTTPKPLLPVNNKPLIVHHIERLAQTGIKDIVINYAWLGEKITAYLGDGSRWGVNILWSKEQQALGTGGGIKNALPLLGTEPFIMVSADIVTNYPFGNLQKMQLKPNILGHLLLITNPDHHRRGDYCLEGGLVMHRHTGLQTLTFASIALLTPALFRFGNESATTFSLTLPFGRAIDAGRLSGEHFTGYHCNADTLKRLQNAEREYPKFINTLC